VLWTLICFSADPDPVPDKKLKNFTAEKNIFLKSKIAIYLSLGLHEGLQATAEAFSP
jgi:hypothetical protein